MKLIEFISKKEGCEISSAWLTFGRFDGYYGFYISFCIPVIKMTKVDWRTRSTVYGWYGYRIWFGIEKLRKIRYIYNGWWEVIKVISRTTEEQRLNELSNNG